MSIGVVESVRQGNYLHEWATLPSGLTVSRDALSVDGVRKNVTFDEAECIAQLLDCRLPNPEHIDERWEHSLKLVPKPMKPSIATEQEQSEAIGQLRMPGIVANCGKHWCADGAVYGWHVPTREGSVWRGIPVYPPFSDFTQDWVIQKPYRGHGRYHSDYSMMLVMVKFANNEVPRKDTPIDPLSMAQVLRNGHLGALGELPSWERTGVAWAQCMLESGRGRRMWGHNFGNITAGKSWKGQYYVMKVPPPDPPVLKFRSHADFHDGAKDYWRMLSGRYASAFPYFDKGDAAGAAAALKARGYFTAELGPYASTMAKLYKEFVEEVQPLL